MSTRAVFALVAAVTATTACNRPLFDKPRPAIERINPEIPPGRFHVLATIAGGNARTDLRISATARQQLADSGFTVIRKAGRWETQQEAVRQICAPGQVPPVDGVLFVWYNRLELRDCTTEAAAYEINGQGSVGITAMVDRLVQWLKRDSAATPSSTAP